MEINPEIIKILKEFKIDKSQGLLCLLGIYFNLDVESTCNEDTVKAINLTKIVEKDFSKKGILVWNMPLFKGEEYNFEWVKTQWLPLYSNINPSRAASSVDSIKKMQQFFAKYPQYRMQDVIKATTNYLASVKNSEYLLHSNNFILSGEGAKQSSTLLAWCEKLELSKNTQVKGKIVR